MFFYFLLIHLIQRFYFLLIHLIKRSKINKNAWKYKKSVNNTPFYKAVAERTTIATWKKQDNCCKYRWLGNNKIQHIYTMLIHMKYPKSRIILRTHVVFYRGYNHITLSRLEGWARARWTELFRSFLPWSGRGMDDQPQSQLSWEYPLVL